MVEPTVFSRVSSPWWDDAPALLVGTGPSLAGFDLNRLRGLGHILAVKSSVWDLPFAEACFGLDLPWMRRENGRLAELAARMPLYLAVPKAHPPMHTHVAGAIYLERDRQCGPLSEDLGIVEAGANSGFGAFNFAVLKRARTIFLFGYDYTGGDHYCPERYAHNPRNKNAHYWPKWGENFRLALPQLTRLGVQVFNASPASSVTAFPKVTIEQALEHLDRLRSERSGSVCGGEIFSQTADDHAHPDHGSGAAPVD